MTELISKLCFDLKQEVFVAFVNQLKPWEKINLLAEYRCYESENDKWYTTCLNKSLKKDVQDALNNVLSPDLMKKEIAVIGWSLIHLLSPANIVHISAPNTGLQFACKNDDKDDITNLINTDKAFKGIFGVTRKRIPCNVPISDVTDLDTFLEEKKHEPYIYKDVFFGI
jgi:hypothetical protein